MRVEINAMKSQEVNFQKSQKITNYDMSIHVLKTSLQIVAAGIKKKSIFDMFDVYV